MLSVRVENDDFSKVMNSFFDLDEIPQIKRSCAHYVWNLIRCRRLFEILVVAKKSAGGVKIFLAT